MRSAVASTFGCAALAAATSGFHNPLVKPSKLRLINEGLCDLTGPWIDNSGSDARIQQFGTLVNATSVSPNSWSVATGQVVSPSSLWMSFGPTNNLTAVITSGCTQLQWSNGETWTLTEPLSNITTVHVVFMTHLDIGFTLLARDVCEEYFFKHFPNGIALAAQLRAMGGPAQYAVTSHPWLIQEYLDGATQCAHTPRNGSMIQLMTDAIARNDVRWHGKPMNNFVELEDGPWFATSLGMSGRLNAQFNKTWGSTTCKSTDVPGMSKSTIPYFAAAGKKALHIGYNSACRVANVPMAFAWSHEASGTQLLTFINNNYGSIIVVPGSTHALAFFYSPDNSGPPPTAKAVTDWWASTQAQFPNAQLVLSSLDDFAHAVLPIMETLPQVTGEIGQSWSYGAPADPLKIATFRAVRRTRNDAVTAGWLDPQDADLYNYERRLWVGGPEHNWGVCFGCFLPAARSPQGNWSNAQFHALRYRADYAFVESGNIEKRNFTLPLPPSGNASAGYMRFLDQAAQAVLQVRPTAPSLATDFTPVSVSSTFSCGRFSGITFSPVDGSLTGLVDASTGHQWASEANTLGSFQYQTYTEGNFDIWNKEYNPGCGPPCGDFAKYGMDTASPVNVTWLPTLQGLYRGTGAGTASACTFLAVLSLDPATVTSYGGMQSLWLNITVDADPTTSVPTVQVELSWMNKTATRLAESSWLSFNPLLGSSPDLSRWTMDVLGYPVSPVEVVDMGTRHIHAVWEGVAYEALDVGGPAVKIRTWDVPLVSPGDSAHLLWYDGLNQPDLSGGWYFNIMNNVWGTAFPQWYGDDGKARFTLELQAPATR